MIRLGVITMGNNCVVCGAPIPDEHNICSMCADDYYREWAEEQQQQAEEEQEEQEEKE